MEQGPTGLPSTEAELAVALQQTIAERDAVQRELDRLRAIPELRVGQRVRHLVRRRRNVEPPADGGPQVAPVVPMAAISESAPVSTTAHDEQDLSHIAEPDDPTGWISESPAWHDTAYSSLAVQVVLFRNDVDQQLRLARAIEATLRYARQHLDLERVVVRYGDSSPTPCLSEADVNDIRVIIGSSAEDVSFHFFDANLGSSGGSNELASLGHEDVLWVLNPDTFPAPVAAAELLSALSRDGTGAAEARQLPIEHPKEFDRSTGETPWVSGFSTMFRRDAFDGVGGFDSHFFPMYCDDVDVSWRLRLAGWLLRHVPAAVVVHDKPIADDGAVGWSNDVARMSHLARLWLYRRYGRADLEQEFLDSIDVDTDVVAGEAIAEFKRRIALGDEPEALQHASQVATFTGSAYAQHRFGYAT